VRVLLDSNVLVSAYGTRGLCTDVLRLVLSEHELLSAEVVLEEVERILTMKFRLPEPYVQEVIAFLRGYHVEPRPSSPPEIPVRDPDDAWVLASALAAGADVLVSGDSDLLEWNGRVGALQILSPRGFWDLNRGTQPRT
jgi:putative PIN family toxin of toxin-antitoxin system